MKSVYRKSLHNIANTPAVDVPHAHAPSSLAFPQTFESNRRMYTHTAYQAELDGLYLKSLSHSSPWFRKMDDGSGPPKFTTKQATPPKLVCKRLERWSR